MRRMVLVIVLVLAVFVSSAVAGDTLTDAKPDVVNQQGLCRDDLSGQELARRGCCSWHGGVCGCRGGRVVCCDGSFSPSCTCLDGSVQSPDGG